MFIEASRGSSGSLCWAAVVASGITMVSLLSQIFLLSPRFGIEILCRPVQSQLYCLLLSGLWDFGVSPEVGVL